MCMSTANTHSVEIWPSSLRLSFLARRSVSLLMLCVNGN